MKTTHTELVYKHVRETQEDIWRQSACEHRGLLQLRNNERIGKVKSLKQYTGMTLLCCEERSKVQDTFDDEGPCIPTLLLWEPSHHVSVMSVRSHPRRCVYIFNFSCLFPMLTYISIEMFKLGP